MQILSLSMRFNSNRKSKKTRRTTQKKNAAIMNEASVPVIIAHICTSNLNKNKVYASPTQTQNNNFKKPVFDAAHLIILARNATPAKRHALGVKKMDTIKKCVGREKQTYQERFLLRKMENRSVLTLCWCPTSFLQPLANVCMLILLLFLHPLVLCVNVSMQIPGRTGRYTPTGDLQPLTIVYL